ncbi:hypothetical protein NN561_017619 [Cricetulus griseus]
MLLHVPCPLPLCLPRLCRCWVFSLEQAGWAGDRVGAGGELAEEKTGRCGMLGRGHHPGSRPGPPRSPASGAKSCERGATSKAKDTGPRSRRGAPAALLPLHPAVPAAAAIADVGGHPLKDPCRPPFPPPPHARPPTSPLLVHPGRAHVPGTPAWHRAPTPRLMGNAPSDPRSAIWTRKKISKAKAVSPDY